MNETSFMVIGASWEQVPLVREAMRRGMRVLATDPDPNAEGLALATDAAILAPRDLPEAVRIARQHNVMAVTADECDYSKYAATVVALELGLPNDGLHAAQVTTNKHWMREQCSRRNVLQPRSIPCRTAADAHRAIEVMDFPVVVKPVDNRGAFGVLRVERREDLDRAFLHALANSHSREVLIEAFVSGRHLTVDGLFDSSGKHHNLAVAHKAIMQGDRPIITQVDYPADLDADELRYVLQCNDAVIKALGLERGATHGEYIMDEHGRCFLLEMANRGGGVLTSAVIVPALSGVDVSAALVDSALGQPVEVAPVATGRHVRLRFLTLPPGRLTDVRGLDSLAEHDQVLHLRLNVSVGQKIRQPRSGAERHGFIILDGADADDLAQLEQEVADVLSVSVS